MPRSAGSSNERQNICMQSRLKNKIDLFICLMHAVGLIVNYSVVHVIPNERNLFFNQNLNTLSIAERTEEHVPHAFLFL